MGYNIKHREGSLAKVAQTHSGEVEIAQVVTVRTYDATYKQSVINWIFLINR